MASLTNMSQGVKFLFIKISKVQVLYVSFFAIGLAFILLSAIDLINNLLQVKTRKRYTVDKSLSHIWLQVSKQNF